MVSWDVHEKWVDTLFRSYAADVSQATKPVTLAQLIKADCETWTLLAREHHTVKPDAHGNKPLDGATSRLQQDPRIIVFLMPQPAGRQSVHDTDPKIKPDPKPKPRPGKRGRNAPNVQQELQDCHHAINKLRRASRFVGLIIWRVVAKQRQVAIHRHVAEVHMSALFAGELVTVFSSAGVQRVQTITAPKKTDLRNNTN